MDELNDTTGVVETTTPDLSSVTEPEQRDESLPEGTETEVIADAPYTDEELTELNRTGGVVDRKRLTPAQDALRRTLESGYTQKFQEAAELKRQAEEILAKAKTPEPEEPYFADEKKNTVFKDYLKSPLKIVTDINAEIARLEGVTPYDDDGNPNGEEYRKARTSIAYWQGVKDEFGMKRQELAEQQRTTETVKSELGADYPKLEAYAQAMGFTVKDFRGKPELRKSIKTMYELANAGASADHKVVKPVPPKTAVSQGGVGDRVTKKEPDTSKMTDAEYYAYWKQQRIESARNRLGG